MKFYDTYKDSNLEHIGKIPKNWEIKRIKYFTTIRKEKSLDGSETLLSLSEYKGVIPRQHIVDENKNLSHAESLIGYSKVYKDDLVNNIMLMWKRGLGVSKYNGIISPAYSVFKFIDSIPKYFHYLFRTEEYIQEFKKNSKGIIDSRLRLYDDEFGRIYSHFPHIHEQQKIVKFLDQKTHQIDSLIKKIQIQIQILKEQKDLYINKYVTQGLNKNSKMKDCGVKWIGKIPSHWKIKKIKYVSKVATGNTPPTEKSELYYKLNGEGYLWAKPSDLSAGWKGINNTEEKLTEEGRDFTRIVPKNSVLLCCIGNSSGKYSISNTELSTNQQINSITFDEGLINSRYGMYYIAVLGQDLLKWMNIVTLPIITKNDILNTKIIIPPMPEQIKIKSKLDDILSKINKEINLKTKKIKLLENYLQILISKTVTGKLYIQN